MSNITHKSYYAWDFDLPANTPIVSAQLGRVVYLVDDSTVTGTVSPAMSNMICVDLGGRRFATYAHHRAKSALVKVGDIVSVGTPLAEVGSSGTTAAHLHFDVRGGDWSTSHDVRFIGHENQAIQIIEGQNYLSATKESVSKESFLDSVSDGLEFLRNGIKLVPGLPAYSLPVETEIVFRGEILKKSEHVFFLLWQLEKKKRRKLSTLSFHSSVDRSGEFLLKVFIPDRFTGCFWYMLSTRPRSGSSFLPGWIH